MSTHRTPRFAPLPLALLTLLAVLFVTALPANLTGGELLRGKALLSALRAGGHVIYFRHAQTDWSQSDHVEQAGDWESCDPKRVRQLSDEGRATAGAIGAAMRKLGIPVGQVEASPYCRTMETARLLGLGEVRPSLRIMNMLAARFVGGRDALIASARAAIGTPPREGMNTVLVAHGNVVRDATGAYPGEAGAAIFRPDGKGGFTLVALLDPADWQALAGN